MYSLDKGKVHQKVRTFNALVEIAAGLLSKGQSFTIAEVADLAKVGRTTAYRYFPTLEALTAHAALWRINRIEANDIEGILPDSFPVEERLASLIRRNDESTSLHEAEYRTMLRLSLDGPAGAIGQPKRLGLRTDLVDKVIGCLEPVLGRSAYRRLRAALCMFVGVESTIVMKDVCLLDPKQAREVKLWGAQCILQAALADQSSKEARRRDSQVPKDASHRTKKASESRNGRGRSSSGRQRAVRKLEKARSQRNPM
jgi:AcrR family transcriptional regulator